MNKIIVGFRAAGLLGWLMTLVAASIAHAGAPSTAPSIQVDTDQSQGLIKRDIAGVALGGNTPTYLHPAAVKAMRPLGIRYVRLEGITGDGRQLYNPVTKRWNWQRLDEEIDSIKGSGAAIIADIFYTPRFLASDVSPNYFGSAPGNLKSWSEYVTAIVRHVNIEKQYGIHYWEIWNEPSGPAGLRNYRRDYPPLYAATAAAIKAADPTAKVGGIADNPDYPANYKFFFDYVDTHSLPLDFLTFHWYGEWTRDTPAGTSPQRYADYGRQLDALFFNTFKRHVPVFLTEWNFVGEAPRSDPGKTIAYIAESFYWLQESPIEVACFFRPEDYRNPIASLLDTAFRLRAPGRIFQMFSMLPDQRLKVVGASHGVKGLAARSGSQIAILLSRDDSEGIQDMSFPLKITGSKLQGFYKLRVYIEDAGSASVIGPLAVQSEFKSNAAEGVLLINVTMKPRSAALVMIDRSNAPN